MYEPNKVYIWQNLKGPLAALNGQETTVTSACSSVQLTNGETIFVWRTDTIYGEGKNKVEVFAEPGELRLKQPPSGEQSILNLFKQPEKELEPA